MTLYRFSLSSLLVALVAFQHTYASINLDENQILKAVIEEYCINHPDKEEHKKAKRKLNEEIRSAIITQKVASSKTQCIDFTVSKKLEAPASFVLPSFQNQARIPEDSLPFVYVASSHTANFATDIRSQIAEKNLQLRI